MQRNRQQRPRRRRQRAPQPAPQAAKGRPGRGKPGAKKKNGKGQSSQLSDIARMIADPCHGPAVNPEYGASQHGYVSKFKSVANAVAGSSVNAHGYMVWFPDYQGGSNLYAWNSVTADDRPSNTPLDPFGMAGNHAVRGGFIDDPAQNWVDGSSVQDARMAAACMKLTYTGSMSALKGRVGTIGGITRDQLLNERPSVNEMFQLCSDATRLSPDGVEFRARPGPNSEVYRTAGNQSNTVSPFSRDNCFDLGYGSHVTKVNPTGARPGSGIAIIWTDCDVHQRMIIEFFKTIEWRPTVTSGIVQVEPHTAGDNLAEKALKFLDTHVPNWQHRIMHTAASAATSVAGRLSQMALGGAATPTALRELRNAF